MKVNLDIIEKKRKTKGFTIYDMADKLKLTNGSMYWKREAGQCKFKPEEIMMVAKILQIPMTKLFLSEEYSKMEIESKEVS